MPHSRLTVKVKHAGLIEKRTHARTFSDTHFRRIGGGMTDKPWGRTVAMPIMAPMQVLLHGSLAAPTGFDLVANPNSRRWVFFDDPTQDKITPRFGPQELIELAQEALAIDFTIRRFEFTTDRNAPVSDDSLIETADATLRHALLTGGSQEAMYVLGRELLSVVVTGVVLYKPGVGQLTLRQGGVVFAKHGDDARPLLSQHWFHGRNG